MIMAAKMYQPTTGGDTFVSQHPQTPTSLLLQQQQEQSQSVVNSIPNYAMPFGQLVNGIDSNRNAYFPTNLYSPPLCPIASNLRLQSANSLQSLDHLRPTGLLNKNNPTGDNLISRGILIGINGYCQQNRNVPEHYYQTPTSLQQHEQRQKHQPLLPRRSDSFSQPQVLSTVKMSDIDDTKLLGNITPNMSNLTETRRVRPMERRRYTQYGIYYPTEFENDLAQQKQEIVKQHVFMNQSYQVPKINNTYVKIDNTAGTNSVISEENLINSEPLFTDLHLGSNTESTIPLSMRRRKPVNARRAHVVSAFEQSLNNMSQRLQNLTNTTTRKDSELHELRATIDALRSQAELGLLKKPPINRPCELNRSNTKDTLKQGNVLTASSSAGESEEAIHRSSLTNSNLSLIDVDSHSLQQAENSTDKVPSTSGLKSSGVNTKKNGWLRNSLGKAFRKKSSSIHSQSGLHIAVSQSHANSVSLSTGRNNILSITPNGHLINGLSPSNSSTSSSSWSASGISAGGQSNATTTTTTTTTLPNANEQTDRLTNTRTLQPHQLTTHVNQSTCLNQSVNQSDLDKSSQLPTVENDTKSDLLSNEKGIKANAFGKTVLGGMRKFNQKLWQDEVNQLKYQLAERESKLTDVQLEALASAHQVDQLRDEMSRLYSELKYLRTDNERLQILVSHLQDSQKIQLPTTSTTIIITSSNTSINNIHLYSTRCNSLPQTTFSKTIRHDSIRSSEIDNTFSNDTISNDRQSYVIKLKAGERNWTSGLFIGLSDIINNPRCLIAIVNVILIDCNHDNDEFVYESTFNIGIIELSKLKTWQCLNNILINLFELYSFYLNLNYPHDIQINELKQYSIHIDELNNKLKLKFNDNTLNHTVQLYNYTIENPQKLIDLIQSHWKQSIIQLSIEQFPCNNTETIDHLTDINLSNHHLNYLVMKTLLNREILCFYLKQFITYHFIIFYGNDDIYMKIIANSLCDHIRYIGNCIYLVGTWILSTTDFSKQSQSLPIQFENFPIHPTNTISYPEHYQLYTPVQCINELMCWIKIDHSLCRLYMIRYLRKQLIHSLVNNIQRILASNLVNNDFLEKFFSQAKYYENLIQWIEQVCDHLDQFLNDVQNLNRSPTIDHIYLINSSLFLNLPFNDPMACESWFIQLWNNDIAEYVKKVIMELSSSDKSTNFVNCSDPTEWILSTWPWSKIDFIRLYNESSIIDEHNSSEINLPSLKRLTELC
ncbi:unnamed protein product [Heterobilharzia americana]|nr:unnamed protein product [Heterobilharzia americana]